MSVSVALLAETDPVRESGLVRRCFTAPDLQLFVWEDAGGAPVSFQLAHGDDPVPRVLEYRGSSLFHYELDRGERGFTGIDTTAFMRASREPADVSELAARFAERASNLPGRIREFVSAALR